MEKVRLVYRGLEARAGCQVPAAVPAQGSVPSVAAPAAVEPLVPGAVAPLVPVRTGLLGQVHLVVAIYWHPGSLSLMVRALQPVRVHPLVKLRKRSLVRLTAPSRSMVDVVPVETS